MFKSTTVSAWLLLAVVAFQNDQFAHSFCPRSFVSSSSSSSHHYQQQSVPNFSSNSLQQCQKKHNYHHHHQVRVPYYLNVVSEPTSSDNEIIEIDEDDFNLDELYHEKEQWEQTIREMSRQSVRDPEAVQKAQDAFDHMYEAFVVTEDSLLCPNVDTYNLLLETHAYSKDPTGAEKAQEILSRMEAGDSSTHIAKPNLASYLNVMDAWAMRKQPEKVKQILERFERRYEETKDEKLLPIVLGYNKLIKSYGITGDIEAAQAVFDELLQEEDENSTKRANYKSWVQIMKAYAHQKDGADQVQQLLQNMLNAYRMGEEDFRPRMEVYNAVIYALGQKEADASKAEAMLYEMMRQYHEGDEEMRPNAETFRQVIYAFNGRGRTANKLCMLLELQENLYKASNYDPDLKFSVRVFNTVLAAVARSRDSLKSAKAKRLVKRMREMNDPRCAPNYKTLYNLLMACAYTNGDAEENLAAFQIAVETLNEMRESESYNIDASVYAMFIKACGNLMPPSRKRDSVVENIFQKCTNEGLVDVAVLNEFEKAASGELQLKLLGGFVADGIHTPEEWSSNTSKLKP